jgi:hypothetical protein
MAQLKRGSQPVKNQAALNAARTVECALQFAESYVNGTIREWAVTHDDYDGSDPVSWIYHAARDYGEDAQHAGYQLDDAAWHAAGEIADLACTIVQKWAANSTGGGAVPNIMLERATAEALLQSAADYEEVSGIACKWRFHDALDDTVEPTEELRLAFQAAWDIDQYEFAYGLCQPVPAECVVKEEDGDRAEISTPPPAD